MAASRPLPRTMPLVGATLIADGDPIPAKDVHDDLTSSDAGSYELDRGAILFRRSRGHNLFAVRAPRSGVSAWRVMTEAEAIAWITLMITPHRTARSWRLRAAVFALRKARKASTAADVRLDAIVEELAATERALAVGRTSIASDELLAARKAKAKRQAEHAHKALRKVAEALYAVRYLLKQRARIRRNRWRQLSLPFAG